MYDCGHNRKMAIYTLSLEWLPTPNIDGFWLELPNANILGPILITWIDFYQSMNR